MDTVKIIVFDEEELTKTLIESYLKELTFPFELEKYNEFEENFIKNPNENKIIVVNINKLNTSILNTIEKYSKLKQNNFIVISYDNSTDLNVQALRAGAKDILLKPLIKSDFVYAIQKVYKKELQTLDKVKNGKIFTVSSIDKGMGKTTFLVNLAKEMADVSGENVLLIDFNNDINDRSILLNVDIIYNTTYYMNKLTEENALELLSNIPKYKNSTLHIMANGFLRNGTENIDIKKLGSVFNILKKHYKYILIDKSSFDEDLDKELTILSDTVFFLISPMMSSMEKIKNILESKYANKQVNLVLNKYEQKNVANLEQIQSLLGREIYCVIPKNFMASGTALNNSKTLKEVAPNIDIVQAYIKLAKDIISRD